MIIIFFLGNKSLHHKYALSGIFCSSIEMKFFAIACTCTIISTFDKRYLKGNVNIEILNMVVL